MIAIFVDISRAGAVSDLLARCHAAGHLVILVAGGPDRRLPELAARLEVDGVITADVAATARNADWRLQAVRTFCARHDLDQAICYW